ncbi:hypothetical protein [Minisyncoccus archaeiphilus]|jgi:hypothetical protein|uniref:hypothetical protein n=1 Tax=Minisyncoccus archaeiphilus TaxID=3238481 RepID=UPI00399CD92F
MMKRNIFLGKLSLIPLSALGICFIVYSLFIKLGIRHDSIIMVYAIALTGSSAIFYAGYFTLIEYFTEPI